MLYKLNMKQISINWVHFAKADAREQALKALAIAKEQEIVKMTLKNVKNENKSS